MKIVSEIDFQILISITSEYIMWYYYLSFVVNVKIIYSVFIFIPADLFMEKHC